MQLKDILIKNGFHFNKRFGQNFLTDKNLLSSIVEKAGIKETDTVIEIGVGGGTLTSAIAQRAKRVIGFCLRGDGGGFCVVTFNSGNQYGGACNGKSFLCAGSSWSGGSMGTVARPVAGVSLGHGKYDDSGDDYDRNRYAVGNPTRKGEKS